MSLQDFEIERGLIQNIVPKGENVDNQFSPFIKMFLYYQQQIPIWVLKGYNKKISHRKLA